MKKVYVGLSGGVDSSVAALLLKQQGYEVIGVYMKNWSQDIAGMRCGWRQDYQDAKRISVQLGIEFKLYDFQKQYKQKVVDYMVQEYKAGRTPNPDIVCNQEVKFKLFLQTAIEDGADLIATGHYARVKDGKLFMAKDSVKDQTYFLYRISKHALNRAIFPLGNLTKFEVREIARENNLITAGRKESMGICFVGEVGIKDFLSEYIDSEQGDIIDQQGNKVGSHEGAVFFTIGQRRGLNVGGGMPFYVVGKDMAKNEIHVTTDLQDENLWNDRIRIIAANWIDEEPGEADLHVRTRHRADLIPVISVKKIDDSRWSISLGEEVRALTPGQSAVLYSGDKVLGGGVVI